MRSYTARRQHGSCTFQPVHSGVPRARGEHSRPRSPLFACFRIKQNFCCPAFLPLTSPSETRSHFRFQHQMQSGPEILITKNAAPGTSRCIYQVPIGYVSQPKQDKRNQHFVSAEVHREVLASARFSCLARSCASTSTACLVRPTESIIPRCMRSCVSRPALRRPSFAWLSSCVIWS